MFFNKSVKMQTVDCNYLCKNLGLLQKTIIFANIKNTRTIIQFQQ